MENVGYAALQIIPSVKGFESKLTSDTSGIFRSAGSSGGKSFSDSAGKTLVSGFKEHAKKAALAGAAAFTALGIGAFKLASDSIAAASDLAESQNKVQQVFGKSADTIFKFTSRTADAFGQTNQQARDAVSTFGIFGHVAGLGEQKTAKFAIRMDKLASDLASFHNTSPEQAIEAIGAALRGESEPIRAYGVLLDEASLKAKALQIGLIKPVKDKAKIQSYQVALIDGQKKYNEAVKKYGTDSLEALKAEANLGTARDRLKKATEGTIAPLTQQQKVIAAQKLILDQTKVAQGDFARTSDGLANSQRRLSARWEDAKAKLGEGLLPIVQDFVGFLLDKGIPKVDEWVGIFEKKGVPALKHFYEKAQPVADKVLPALHDVLKATKPILKAAASEAGNLADAFSKMPKWAQTAIAGGLLAGKFGGFKLAKGMFGGKGLLGGIATKASPLPVLVTNPGFAGNGGESGGRGRKGSSSTYVDEGNEDRRRRRRRGPGAGTAVVAGVIGDELTGGKVSEVLTHPLRELMKEFTFPFTRGEGSAFAGLGQSQDFLLNKAKADGSLYRGGDLSLSDPQFKTGVDKNQQVVRGFTLDVEKSIATVKRYQRVLDGTPGQIKTQVGLSGYEKAIGQIQTLLDGIDALAERGVDNGVPYLHGGSRSGPVIHVDKVETTDPNKFVQWSQKKAQQAGMGGRP